MPSFNYNSDVEITLANLEPEDVQAAETRLADILSALPKGADVVSSSADESGDPGFYEAHVTIGLVGDYDPQTETAESAATALLDSVVESIKENGGEDVDKVVEGEPWEDGSAGRLNPEEGVAGMDIGRS